MASPPRAQVVTWVSIMFILFRETNFCYPKTSAAKQKKRGEIHLNVTSSHQQHVPAWRRWWLGWGRHEASRPRLVSETAS